MADTPKHKIFFGIPYGITEPANDFDPNAVLPTVSQKLPCFTFDTSKTVFSSGSLSFDCGNDFDFEFAAQTESGGFRFDNNVVTMDTTSILFN